VPIQPDRDGAQLANRIDAMTRLLFVFVFACGAHRLTPAEDAPSIQTIDAPGDASSTCGGELDWVTASGNGGWDVANGVAVLPDGSATVTGFFQYGVRFGEGEPTETLLSAQGQADIYVAHYRSDGSLAWAKQATGPGDYDLGVDIAAAPDGSTVMTGTFESTNVFAAGDATETHLASAGLGDIFVARYGADGALMWATRAGGSGDDEAYSSTIVGDQVFVAGRFQSDAHFGTSTLHSAGGNDGFVASYGLDGNVRWARRIGGTNDESAMATAAGGGVYVTHYFSGTISFEPDGTEISTPSAASIEMYVARYREDGSLDWVRKAGGSDLLVPGRLVATDDGGVVIVGSYQGTVTFGAGELGETTLSSGSGEEPLFLARYQKNGQLAWAHRVAVGPNSITGAGIAVMGTGDLLVSGDVAGFPANGAAVFGAGGGCAQPLVPTGDTDAFIARFSAEGEPIWVRRAAGSFPQAVHSGRISTDRDRTLVVAGMFTGTATFGAGEPAQHTVSSHGSADLFLAKLRL
jgi:hypothetical protein